jgi:hypothetical protein
LSFSEFIESDAFEIGRVKEEILLATGVDKSEAIVRDSLDCTFSHLSKSLKKVSCSVTRKQTPRLLHRKQGIVSDGFTKSNLQAQQGVPAMGWCLQPNSGTDKDGEIPTTSRQRKSPADQRGNGAAVFRDVIGGLPPPMLHPDEPKNFSPIR